MLRGYTQQLLWRMSAMTLTASLGAWYGKGLKLADGVALPPCPAALPEPDGFAGGEAPALPACPAGPPFWPAACAMPFADEAWPPCAPPVEEPVFTARATCAASPL